MRIAYVSPFVNPKNRYTELQISDMQSLGFATKTITAAAFSDWSVRRNDKFLLLNWYEDRLSQYRFPTIGLIISLSLLLIIRLRVKHIVWIRHNFNPHSNLKNKKLYHLFARLIAGLSDSIVTHAEVAEWSSVVIPHPMYCEEGHANILTERAGFLSFGTIRKNKNIEGLIENWPTGYTLDIVGLSEDEYYLSSLKSIAINREPDVTVTNTFLTDEDLDARISAAKWCVINNDENTAVVSGAFFHAASLGANILMHKGRLGDLLSARYKFVTTYELSELADVMANLTYIPASDVISYLKKEHGKDSRRKKWREFFKASGIEV